MYIQKGLTLGSIYFFFRILSIFNTHIQGEGRMFFKEIYSGVYPKLSNSQIHSIIFKLLLLKLIFLYKINPSKMLELPLFHGKIQHHSPMPMIVNSFALISNVQHKQPCNFFCRHLLIFSNKTFQSLNSQSLNNQIKKKKKNGVVVCGSRIILCDQLH